MGDLTTDTEEALAYNFVCANCRAPIFNLLPNGNVTCGNIKCGLVYGFIHALKRWKLIIDDPKPLKINPKKLKQLIDNMSDEEIDRLIDLELGKKGKSIKNKKNPNKKKEK